MDAAGIARQAESDENGLPRYLRVGKVRVQSRYALLFQNNGLTHFASVFKYAGGERLDKPGLAGWRERLRVVLNDLDGTPITFYLKRYTRPPIGEQVRRLLGGRPRDSTAGREWRAIQRLTAAGLPVPGAVAFGQDMRLGCLEKRSFLLLEAVAGESLEAWLTHAWRRDARGEARQRQQTLIAAMARLVARLHAHGFVHRDLYASHVFVADERADAVPRLTLIDLQRVFQPRWRETRWIIKDLAALLFSTERFVSRTDRHRFWRLYVQAVDRPGWLRRLPARIEARVRRMCERGDRRIERESSGA